MVNLPQYPLFSEFVRWLTLSPVLSGIPHVFSSTARQVCPVLNSMDSPRSKVRIAKTSEEP